jgi:phosphoenolpyruvate-protein kinase (PTS system EI component)
MGADRLSMSPSAIPLIKNLIRHMKVVDARTVLSEVMQMDNEDDIAAHMGRVLEALDYNGT